MPDALEPVGLAELASEGYRYELLASSEEGDSLVVDASEEPPSEDAEEYDVSVPNHTWKLRLSPADGWVNVEMLACIGVLGLSVSVLLAVVVRQEQKSRSLLGDQATTDVLTGLRNRRWFSETVEQWCAAPNPRPFWLLYLDLDGFKGVNDTRGHRWGDMLLAQVARRFEEACGEGCELARLGGDEFVAALPGSDRAATRQVEARLRHALDEPFCIDGCDLSISVSIGVAAFPEAVRRTKSFPCGRPAYVRGEAPQINSGYAHSCLPSDAVGACEHFRRMGRRMPMPLPWRRVRAAARRIVDTAKATASPKKHRPEITFGESICAPAWEGATRQGRNQPCMLGFSIAKALFAEMRPNTRHSATLPPPS